MMNEKGSAHFVDSIDRHRAGKQRAIKESLGHAEEPANHAPFNKMGSQLWNRKLKEDNGGGPVIEMRALGSAGGFVDPHY